MSEMGMSGGQIKSSPQQNTQTINNFDISAGYPSTSVHWSAGVAELFVYVNMQETKTLFLPVKVVY